MRSRGYRLEWIECLYRSGRTGDLQPEDFYLCGWSLLYPRAMYGDIARPGEFRPSRQCDLIPEQTFVGNFTNGCLQHLVFDVAGGRGF